MVVGCLSARQRLATAKTAAPRGGPFKPRTRRAKAAAPIGPCRPTAVGARQARPGAPASSPHPPSPRPAPPRRANQRLLRDSGPRRGGVAPAAREPTQFRIPPVSRAPVQ